MTPLELHIANWEEAKREFVIALNGTPNQDLWKRSHPNLLSIGEITGHVCYWASVKFIGSLSDDEKASLSRGPLVDPRFSYYTNNIGEPVVLEMTAEELIAEFKRQFDLNKASILKINPQMDDKVPWHKEANWGFYLQYTVFHFAYHSGQIYSARHMLGHETEDN